MKCKKCGYDSKKTKQKFNILLCDVCFHFSPNEKTAFDKYVAEEIDASAVETLRTYYINFKEKQKQGMIQKAVKGNLMSRAPFGYNISGGKLILAENFKEVEEIFEEFLNEEKSLRSLAEKHKLSVNGLKKILRNFTYIGKIKFNNQIYEGEHQPLISTTLFNHVQNKLEKKGIK